MSFNRFPQRDPRTVARDIPGVLDILFPRLTGGLVGALNKTIFAFEGIDAVSETLVDKSYLQKSMLFELAFVRAESILLDSAPIGWIDCLRIASGRQRHHYDAKIPSDLTEWDIEIANHAAHNLVEMLLGLSKKYPDNTLSISR